jgi:hypothetical protein
MRTFGRQTGDACPTYTPASAGDQRYPVFQSHRDIQFRVEIGCLQIATAAC